MFFRSKEIKCSKCNKVIQSNEKFLAHMTMPSMLNLPYGTLDAVLRKVSDVIICSDCYESQD